MRVATPGWYKRSAWLVGGCAALLFLLALLSPLEMVRHDPAVALVASQALLEHRTLALDVYRGHPDFAYDLDVLNPRIKEVGGRHYYYNLGVPVAVLPAVAAARLLGYDMLVQDHEFALQNLISAVLTALGFVLCYRLARSFVAPGPSLAIALVSNLGSPLVSTHATAMWSSAFASALFSWLLLHLIARRRKPLDLRSCVFPVTLLAAAFLIRPTAAFLGAAFLVFLSGEKDRRLAIFARLVLGLGTVACVLAAFELVPWLPRHYSPKKILPREVPWTGIYGTLFSPSRGLFVFMPYLIPVAVAAVRRWRALAADRFLRCVLIWIALHVAGVMARTMWWGGHSYGPRFLAEVMPGFVVITAWAWRELGASSLARRRTFAAAFLALGLAAVFIHGYQGLFNPATQRWNTYPNVDKDHLQDLLLSWRYPQFLATDAALEARFLDVQRRTFAGVYSPGEELRHDSPYLLFVRWHETEPGWRWSRGESPALVFDLAAHDTVRDYVLDFHASSLGGQDVSFRLNGAALAERRFEGHRSVHELLVVRRDLLRPGENTLLLEIPGARRTPNDARVLGLAFRSLRLVPLEDRFTVNYRDDAFFGSGFSEAEEGWRWSDGTEARLLYPFGGIEPDATYEVELVAGAFGGQRFEVLLNGTSLGGTELRGPEPRRTAWDVPGKYLRPYQVNVIGFRIPDAARPENDPRTLGLRFRSLEISPQEP